jgi:hypothetical protein
LPHAIWEQDPGKLLPQEVSQPGDDGYDDDDEVHTARHGTPACSVDEIAQAAAVANPVVSVVSDGIVSALREIPGLVRLSR